MARWAEAVENLEGLEGADTAPSAAFSSYQTLAKRVIRISSRRRFPGMNPRVRR